MPVPPPCRCKTHPALCPPVCICVPPRLPNPCLLYSPSTPCQTPLSYDLGMDGWCSPPMPAPPSCRFKTHPELCPPLPFPKGGCLHLCLALQQHFSLSLNQHHPYSSRLLLINCSLRQSITTRHNAVLPSPRRRWPRRLRRRSGCHRQDRSLCSRPRWLPAQLQRSIPDLRCQRLHSRQG